MLRLMVIFFVIAAIAGIFGFGELDGVMMWCAKAVFFLFLALFLVSLVVFPMKRL